MIVLRKLFYITFLFIIFQFDAFGVAVKNFNPDSIPHHKRDSTVYYKSIPHHTYSFSIKYVDLFSTHGNRFKGANILVTEKISESFNWGAGVEYSYGAFYSDELYNLHNLSYIPVYFDLTYDIKTNSKFTPFVSVDPGLTFANYNSEFKNNLNTKTLVRELGFYLYTGVGVNHKINDRLGTVIDVGFKGYRMSFNNLDINPHGFVIRAGLVFQ